MEFYRPTDLLLRPRPSLTECRWDLCADILLGRGVNYTEVRLISSCAYLFMTRGGKWLENSNHF